LKEKITLMKSIFFFLLFCATIHAQTITSVYFKNNSCELDISSKNKLDSLSRLKSQVTLKIFGNANPLGNEVLNQILSENRAKAVRNYIEKKAGKNIQLESTVGLGISRQINDNSSEELLAKNRRVDIFIDHYFDKNEKISRKVYPSFLDLKLSSMKVKDTFSLPDINFIGGKHVWLPKAKPKLLQLYKILNENASLVIELQGHICCDYENFDGKDQDLGTFNLSFTRAKAIQDFLVGMGIDSKRIKATGLGHLNPVIYPERTEEDRTKNRRVELVLLKK